jgi:hypothetical protein
MPLTAKGNEIKAALTKEYGSEAKAKQVLYAGKNKGTFTGIDSDPHRIHAYHDACARGDTAAQLAHRFGGK